MRWFGESWGAPINDLTEHTDSPPDAPCVVCHEKIKPGDQGVLLPYVGIDMVDEVPYHLRCFLRDIGIKP